MPWPPAARSIDLLPTEEFDLVLMDWQMPEMMAWKPPGRSASCRRIFRHIPIIALTPMPTPVFAKPPRCRSERYLSKPYSEDALAALLASGCRNRPRPCPVLDLSALHARYPQPAGR